MKTITLRNDFHNSSVNVRVPANGKFSPRVSARIDKELCGQADCKCGKIRGWQEVEIEVDQDSNTGEYFYQIV